MKACPECGSEYRDEVSRCADCDVELVSPEEARARLASGRPQVPPGTKFVPVTEAEDPFQAEAYVAAVAAAQIPVFSRDRRRSLMDVMVTPGAHSFWEIWVPEAELERARGVIEVREQELAEEATSAGEAAEAEERATEGHEVAAESASEEEAGAWAVVLAAAGIPVQLRVKSDVELAGTASPEAPSTQLLVPSALLGRAREILRSQASAAAS